MERASLGRSCKRVKIRKERDLRGGSLLIYERRRGMEERLGGLADCFSSSRMNYWRTVGFA